VEELTQQRREGIPTESLEGTESVIFVIRLKERKEDSYNRRKKIPTKKGNGTDHIYYVPPPYRAETRERKATYG